MYQQIPVYKVTFKQGDTVVTLRVSMTDVSSMVNTLLLNQAGFVTFTLEGSEMDG
jgi:hypothetical protein